MHGQVAAVRCMQVYIGSAGGEAAVKVYELWYGNSMEQHRFHGGAWRREQRAFEELIRAKGAMVLPDLAQVRGTWLPSDWYKMTPFCCQEYGLGWQHSGSDL